MECTETASGIRQSDIDSALWNVRTSASDGNTKGFILAFTNDGSIGFSFLVSNHNSLSRRHNFCLALHAMLSANESTPRYTCVVQGRVGFDPMNPFVQEYLQTAASNMGVDYAKLVSHFAYRHSDWRFQSWENGVRGNSQDNDCVWRTRLWPWVKRIVANHPPCVLNLPIEIRTILLQQLRGHATEGMIVLDR